MKTTQTLSSFSLVFSLNWQFSIRGNEMEQLLSICKKKNHILTKNPWSTKKFFMRDRFFNRDFLNFYHTTLQKETHVMPCIKLMIRSKLLTISNEKWSAHDKVT